MFDVFNEFYILLFMFCKYITVYLINLSSCDYESGRCKLMLTTVMMYSMSLMHYYSCSVNIFTVYIITLSLCDYESGRYKLMLTTGMFNDLCHRLLQATP